MSKIIGIDFGTTKAVAALMTGGQPAVIPDREGRAHLPALVLATPEEDFFVGWEAQKHGRRYEREPVTINSIKRSLGKEADKTWGWLHARPAAVAALILARLKLEVEHALGAEVTRAVVATPAHYEINQRWAVKQAAEAAGLEVLRLINEATAAALAYQHVRGGRRDEQLVVFDFGGGTLDVSVVEIGEGVCEVRATAGAGRLGGDDFDELLVDFCLTEARKQHGALKPLGAFQYLALREAAVRAKIELSAAPESRVYVPGLLQTEAGAFVELDVTVSREQFCASAQTFFATAESVLQRALKDADVKRPDAALLIGGTSRIPAVRDLVRRTLGMEPFVGVNPETCVAQGAAVLGGVLSGTTDLLLLDTCPNTLSVGTLGGAVTALIPRNTTLPTRKSETFTTARDNQTEIEVSIYEGERPLADDNVFIGEVKLSGIPPAPRGVPQIDVTFDLDASGTIRVAAKDMGTGRETKAEMRAPFRLAPAELELITALVRDETAKARARLARAEESARAEAARREVAHWAQVIEEFLARHAEALTAEQAARLRGGALLLTDFHERGAPAEELRRLCQGLAREMDDIAGALPAG
ncbi:MAG TPA: Hsp70 family protein [Pyrinomonadaceae bacterium]|jgi:molecular chaperone DnaK